MRPITRTTIPQCILLLALAILPRALPAGSPDEKAAAPDFTLTDSHGETHTLSQYRGKWIVLEWTNPHCPFVVRHYAGGAMQALQKVYTEKGVVWLTINSTHPGHKDHMSDEALEEQYAEWNPSFTANLIDSDGKVGRLYGAKTTPHMFVIDKDFTLAYQGAIDSDSRGARDDRVNYVDMALKALMEGKPCEITATQPYGCSVKYGR